MSLESLSKVIDAKRIKSDPASLQYYGKDWTTYFDIKPLAIVFPESTEEVQKLVAWARDSKIGLVPSGGRTGLSGGACALHGEVVVSFERMNKILEFEPLDQTVRVEAGLITEALQKFASDKGLFYPVDFAARGSSHIGGNIATNAGGIKVVRYGLTRDWVLSLRVVTGKGEILEFNHGLIKNATGPDFRHLFIGSEGIFGFITEATIKLAKKPRELQVLLISSPELPKLMSAFAEFKSKMEICAFEMFTRESLKYVKEAHHLPDPLSTDSPYYAVCEIESFSEEDKTKILEIFESCLEKEWISDGVVAQSEQQSQTLWKYRELISESLAPRSPYKNDISVKTSQVPLFMDRLEKILKEKYPTWEVVWFGHIGDGNLHVNILRPAEMTKEEFVKSCQNVDELVFQCVNEFNGSISAEHGVGLTKKPFLKYSKTSQEIFYLREIKKLFDPDFIMNPGKVL